MLKLEDRRKQNENINTDILGGMTQSRADKLISAKQLKFVVHTQVL